jgi:hypothetical protein
MNLPRRALFALLIPSVLAACAGSPSTGLPALSSPVAMNAAHALPSQRKLVINLDGCTSTMGFCDGDLNATTLPIKGGGIAGVMGTLTRYSKKGTLTITTSLALPSGVPKPPKAKTLLFVTDVVVNSTAYGSQWGVQLTLPQCKGTPSVSYWSDGGSWQTPYPGFGCGELLVLPPWTRLSAKGNYVVAVYE